MARTDQNISRLQVALDSLLAGPLALRLPPEVSEEKIKGQIALHTNALTTYLKSQGNERGRRTKGKLVFNDTRVLLSRLNLILKGSFPTVRAPVAREFRRVQVRETSTETLPKLKAQSNRVRELIDTAAIALPTDLHPDKLDAHAIEHASALDERKAIVARRQSAHAALLDARLGTAKLLVAIRAFVVMTQGTTSLVKYGYKVPLPPVRPRVDKQEDPATPPPPASETAHT